MNLTQTPICIVAIGAITSVGLDAIATATAVRAGISGFQEHPFMINQEGEPYILSMIPIIDPSIMGVKRYIEIATPAIKEALYPLKGLSSGLLDITVILGLPERRPGLPDDLAERMVGSLKSIVTNHYKIREIRTAYKGHAAGLMALESAAKLLVDGDSQFCLIGGVDSYIDPDTLDWIEVNEQLHVPNNAWGFIPGEAAGFCLLCDLRTAHQYQLPVKAVLISAATTDEEKRIKTETVCVGKGLTAAINDVLQALPKDVRINQTYCDQNGEAYRADEFGFMLTRLSEYFIDPSEFIAPADCWGDVGAACGPLFINLLCAAAEKEYGNGDYSLLWASSEGGSRTAAILQTTMKIRG